MDVRMFVGSIHLAQRPVVSRREYCSEPSDTVRGGEFS